MFKPLINLFCAFIPNRKLRHRLRMQMTFNIKPYINFAKSDANLPNADVNIYQGHGGMKKIIVVLDKKVAYKFPLSAARYDSPKTEKMFTDAFRDISPIYLPKMEIIKMPVNGTNIDVLKYDFVDGTPIGNLSDSLLKKYANTIAEQLGKFLFAIGESNPKSIQHLKPTKQTKSGFMYGWAHNDIGGNFLVDENTGKITAVIDWESAAFCDWSNDMIAAHKFLSKHNAGNIIMKTIVEYAKLYMKKDR